MSLHKKEKLITLLNEVLESDQHRSEIEEILSIVKIPKQHVIDEFLYYNLDVLHYNGNEIYESLGNRVVLHIHNLIKDSWHQERQDTVTEFIEEIHPEKMVDVGFGVPSKYVKKIVLEKKKTLLTFVDLYDAAFKFAEALLMYWQKNWYEHIEFKTLDINSGYFVGFYDLYLLQDVIEHAFDPAGFLIEQIKSSYPEAVFIISLPIGPILPYHYISWNSDQTALKWLENCGLQIKKKKSVYVNPKIDLFSEQLGDKFHDLYTLCIKK